MVAIVSGNGLGLNLGSLSVLGARGRLGVPTQGRNGEGAYVNVATGDLVLRDLDTSLVGLGPDTAALRTYNSQGGYDFDGNADGWQGGPYKSIQNVAGTLRRYDSDGSTSDYVWNATRQVYVATVGAGSALDTIAANGDGTYTWTDGASGASEIYQGSGAGLITSSKDTSGNTLSYSYNALNLLTSVTNADGESVRYTYGGASGHNLTAVSTVLQSGQVLNQVSYTYDAQNRLQTVSVSLNPDGTVPAGSDTLASYVTTYSYDGTSNRVTGITQSDGTSLAFTYVLANGAYKTATVTDGEGKVTTFAYNTSTGTTTVTDPLQVSTAYQYDAQGRLTRITNGVTAANPSGTSQLSYAYNALGDVTSITDGLGRSVVLQYDANGNLTSQVDGAGNTLVRTYDARNQMLTETMYQSAAPSQTQTTRYVYDAGGKNLLRFVVSAEGRVTEYRYNAQGLRTSTIEYRASAYDTTGLGTTGVPTEAQLQTWVGVQDRTKTERSDLAYDFRGQLQTLTTYSGVDANGNGLATGASVAQYVYGQRGELLQTVTPDGRGITQSIYDGLGRVVSTVARSADGTLSATTLTQYDDANGKTTVTLANGLATTSVFDHAGRLVSVVQSSSGQPNLGTTSYAYDADGRLLMTVDPTGARSWFLYDAEGRKVAGVNSPGGLTEYVYDAAGQVTEVIGYATMVDTTRLVDASGNPTAGYNPNPAAGGTSPVTLASIRPAATAQDAKAWNLYDGAGRLAWQVDALGYLTQTQYDDASRITSVTRLATPISTSALGNGIGVTIAFSGTPTVTATQSSNDRTTARIYDRDGLLRGTIDGEGYVTELRYDAAGRVVETIAYANKATGYTGPISVVSLAASATSAGSVAGLVTATASDLTTFAYYDARGQQVGQVDGEGYLTETVYDANGNVTQTIRYTSKALGTPTTTSTLAALRPASSAEDHVATNTWDALGRLSSQTNVEGTVTQYAYDSVGHLTQSTVAVNTSDVRSLMTRYDVQGRVTAELSAVGAAQLTGGQTQAQIDAIWAQYGVAYGYDAAGRRTSSTDANGNRTVFFYDEVGRLRFTVNALGEVSENAYDALGHQTSATVYATRLSTATVAALQGGVLSAPSNLTAAQALATAKTASSSNSATQLAYDARGELIRTTDALGNARTAAYDAFGGVVSTTQAIDATHSLTSTSSYDRRGLVTDAVADTGTGNVNATTSAQYDAFGRLVRSVDANGNVYQQSFDRLGRVVQTTDPTNAVRASTYDAFSRVLTQTDALGNVTHYAYNTAARSLTVTTAEGVAVTTVHNREGQTLTVTDGNGNVTTYGYDRDGNLLTTEVDTLTYGYDEFGNPAPVVVPVVTSSQYDRAGRLIQSTDANGNVVTYAYDAASRLLTRTVDPNGLSLATSYAYDAKGEQVSVTDARGVVTQTAYDLDGRVASQTVDPTGLNLTTTYTYDARGKQLTVTSPGGTATQYVYDDLGRLTQSIADPAGLRLVQSYAYDKAGNAVTRTDGNGNVTRYAYDADSRLVYTVDALGDVQQNTYDANGRITATTAYATRISLTGLSTAPSVADVASRVVTSSQDGVEYRVYDRDSRVTNVVNGTGSVTRLTYDANGNVIDRITYANRITLSSWTSRGTAPTVTADAAHDLRTRTVYDALNRATFSIDGTGAVVKMAYDGDGNVVDRIAYANRVPTGTAATQAALTAAIVADPAHDGHVRRVYDAANRLVWSVDGTGAVTQQVFDAAGNLVKQVAYASRIGAAASPTSVTASGADRVALMAYDAASRLVYQVDALGGVQKQVYDANGNVVQRIAYVNRIAPPTTSSSAATVESIAAAILVMSASDRTTRAVYDAANRLVYGIDASGAVTKQFYDAAGNVVGSTAYVSPLVNPAALPTIAHVADVLAVLVANAPSDRTRIQVFDAANHIAYSVDALGYVTKTSFDGVGRVTSTTLYANQVSGLTPGATSVSPITNANDQTNTYSYDAAGNLVSSTDALGYTESYAYDGAGDKLTFTNKNGSTWNYDYDAAGRLITETDPAVSLTTVGLDASGNLVQGTTASVRVVNSLAYDALGNLRSRTEAVGRPEQRTTSYEYDAVGRQIATTYPQVAVYNAAADSLIGNGATDVADRTETTPTLTTQVTYDAFGDAVANVDVAGNRSYKAYDSLGRVSYEVDALGYVTGYQRNTFGDATVLTRYAVPTTLSAAGSSAPSASQVATAVAALDHSADRAITTQYDQLGRATQVTQPSGWVFNGSGASYQAAPVTKSTYNAFGQLVQTQLLADQPTNTWATTTHYYDRRGLETDTVDAMGYVTTQWYDAAGNVTQRTEWATAATGWTVSSLARPAASADDRTITSIYDRSNRKTSDTRVNVEYSTASNGASQRGNLTTSYGYDAVGNLTRTTDPLGANTYSYYDALGRTTAVAAAARTSTATGTSLTPLTLFARDAFGNVLVKTELANGAAVANASGFTAGASNAADRTTLTQYDAHGNAIELTDAGGFSHFLSYDAMGHLAKLWQGVTGNDGVTHTLFTAYRYDALGRQTAVITPGTNSVVSGGSISVIAQQQAAAVTNAVVYNAFGEIVQRGEFATGTTPGYQEYFNYDSAGRLWRTNSGDGNDKVLLYDLLGRQTSLITSAGSAGTAGVGTDLVAAASAQAVDQMGNSGVRRTDSKLDLDGRVVQQTLPSRQDASSATPYRPVVNQTFDRWGNAISRSDVRNAAWVTMFRYNANNQAIQQTQPDGNGTISGASPVTQWFYDALGREVAVRDANGKVNGQTWDAAGQVRTEVHADNGVIIHAYDAFGQQVAVTDALNHATSYGYDKLGRNTTTRSDLVARYGASGDNVTYLGQQNLTTTRTYDQAGRKLAETNGNGETTRYDYDLRGNVIATSLPLGQVSRAAFDADGRKVGDLDGNNALATWTYDHFGELTGETDIGGASYWFHYDNARQLTAQGNSRGQNRAYTFDAAGQMVQIQDNAIGQTTYYAYNAAGQHVLEQTVQGGTTYQNQTLGYDTLGRLAQVSAMNGVSVHWDYDKVGNRLHQSTAYQTEAQRTVSDYGWVQAVDEYGNPQYSYDEASNTYTPIMAYQQIGSHLVYDTTAHSQELWFAYDAMNRQTLVDGAYNGNAGDLSNITPTQGHIVTYDKNGNRTSDKSWGNQVTKYQPPTTGAWGGTDEYGNFVPYGAPPSYAGTTEGQTASVVTGTDEWGNPTYGTVWWHFNAPPPVQYSNVAGATTQSYAYDALDRLTQVSSQLYDANAGVNRTIALDTRAYDGASRAVATGPEALPTAVGVATPWTSGGNTAEVNALTGGNSQANGSVGSVVTYDAQGRLIEQHIVNPDGSWKYNSIYQANEYWTTTQQVFVGYVAGYDEGGNPIIVQDSFGGYDEAGHPITYAPYYQTQTIQHSNPYTSYDGAGNVLSYHVDAPGLSTTYNIAYAKFDGYKQGTISGYRSDNTGAVGSSVQQYDANGNLVAFVDNTRASKNSTFVNDASGHILYKEEQANRFRELVVNGNVIGQYGVGADPKTPTTSGGEPNYTTQGNFDLNYQAITNSFSGGAINYTIRSGDTLQGIASAVYGDASFWYLIASANGLGGNQDLKVGQTLSVPGRAFGTHNSADTFRPYDPSSVVGDTTPSNLPVPPPRSNGGCGFLQIVLTVVIIAVAVAVTVYTAGAATALMGANMAALGSLGGTMTLGASALAGSAGLAGIAGAAVGGALGSMASQGLSIAAGMQQGFSWGQVAMGAISSSVGAGVGAAAEGVGLGAKALAESPLASIAVAGARAAVSNAATQGVAIAVGLQKSFNWNSVASAGVGSFVGAAFGQGFGGAMKDPNLDLGKFGNGLVAGTMAGIVSGATVAIMRGGRVDMLRVATDAFGNALASSITTAMSAPEQQQQNSAGELEQIDRDAAAASASTQPNANPVAVDGDLGESANAQAPAAAAESAAEPDEPDDEPYKVGKEGKRGFWGVAQKMLKETLQREPTDAEIQDMDLQLKTANPGVKTLHIGQELIKPDGTIDDQARQEYKDENAGYQVRRAAAAAAEAQGQAASGEGTSSPRSPSVPQSETPAQAPAESEPDARTRFAQKLVAMSAGGTAVLDPTLDAPVAATAAPGPPFGVYAGIGGQANLGIPVPGPLGMTVLSVGGTYSQGLAVYCGEGQLVIGPYESKGVAGGAGWDPQLSGAAPRPVAGPDDVPKILGGDIGVGGNLGAFQRLDNGFLGDAITTAITVPGTKVSGSTVPGEVYGISIGGPGGASYAQYNVRTEWKASPVIIHTDLCR